MGQGCGGRTLGRSPRTAQRRSLRPHRRGAVDGFTIVEVLAVLGLLAILLLAALPQLFMPDQVSVETTARQVAADLGLARRLAIARRGSYIVIFTPAGGPYTSYTLVFQDGTAEPGFPKDLPAQITVTGTNQVAFQPSGAATNAALLTFTSGSVTAQVDVVGTTGRTRVSGP